MASQYDNIKTAKDLLVEVRNHGLSTLQEDIVRAQNIFGHSTIEELVELANDTGTKDGWSTGKRGFRSDFYNVLFTIWNWEDATRFWNLQTNPQTQKAIEREKELNKAKAEIKRLNDLCKEEHKKRLTEAEEKLKAQTERDRLDAELYDRDLKIMELKAKLYDLMTKEAK